MILTDVARQSSMQEKRINALHYKGSNSYQPQSGASEDIIRKKAASQSINKTIRMVELGLNLKFRRVGTPTENREEMIEVLRSMLHP